MFVAADTSFKISYPLIISLTVVSSERWVFEIKPENFFQEVLFKPDENSIYSKMLSLSNV